MLTKIEIKKKFNLSDQNLNKDLNGQNNKKKLNDQDAKREKRINLRLNIKKLPFEISVDNFCSRYFEMYDGFKPLFKYKSENSEMKWCFSTSKRTKVFLLIFEANEKGKEIYKESVSNQLPEYSYKTIAQIIDDGTSKGIFEKLAPRNHDSTDSKIRNIRPSEDVIVQFVNWQIDLISAFDKFQNKYK